MLARAQGAFLELERGEAFARRRAVECPWSGGRRRCGGVAGAVVARVGLVGKCVGVLVLGVGCVLGAVGM